MPIIGSVLDILLDLRESEIWPAPASRAIYHHRILHRYRLFTIPH